MLNADASLKSGPDVLEGEIVAQEELVFASLRLVTDLGRPKLLESGSGGEFGMGE